MKKVSFSFVDIDGLPNLASGWQLRCGMVVHRSVLRGAQRSDEHWTVSDPVSGGRVRSGFTMGEAVAEYRRLRYAYGQDWPMMLAIKRQEMAQTVEGLRVRERLL